MRWEEQRRESEEISGERKLEGEARSMGVSKVQMGTGPVVFLAKDRSERG